jgi:hypothetical protein
VKVVLLEILGFALGLEIDLQDIREETGTMFGSSGDYIIIF